MQHAFQMLTSMMCSVRLSGFAVTWDALDCSQHPKTGGKEQGSCWCGQIWCCGLWQQEQATACTLTRACHMLELTSCHGWPGSSWIQFCSSSEVPAFAAASSAGLWQPAALRAPAWPGEQPWLHQHAPGLQHSPQASGSARHSCKQVRTVPLLCWTVWAGSAAPSPSSVAAMNT